MSVWTIGHGTRSVDELIELLTAQGIGRLTDVRTVPRSRHNPQFNRDRLPDDLARAGIGYGHVGDFRADLYYRVNVVEIRIPPLRDRKEEILILAARFLAQFNQQYGRKKQLSPETTARLLEYSWGGNVREMENIIRRMVVLDDGEQAFENLVARRGQMGPSALRSSSLSAEGLREIARCGAQEAERKALANVLERVQWNRAEAARILKVSYKTLLNKITECQLKPPPSRQFG